MYELSNQKGESRLQFSRFHAHSLSESGVTFLLGSRSSPLPFRAQPSLQWLLEAQNCGIYHRVADSSVQTAYLHTQITHDEEQGLVPPSPLSPAWGLARSQHLTGAGEMNATLVHIMISVCVSYVKMQSHSLPGSQPSLWNELSAVS